MPPAAAAAAMPRRRCPLPLRLLPAFFFRHASWLHFAAMPPRLH